MQHEALPASASSWASPTHRCSSTPSSSRTTSSRRPGCCSVTTAVAAAAGSPGPCRRPGRPRRWPPWSARATGRCSSMASPARTGGPGASATAASAGRTAPFAHPTAPPTPTGMFSRALLQLQLVLVLALLVSPGRALEQSLVSMMASRDA
jgi:hypothetical protein